MASDDVGGSVIDGRATLIPGRSEDPMVALDLQFAAGGSAPFRPHILGVIVAGFVGNGNEDQKIARDAIYRLLTNKKMADCRALIDQFLGWRIFVSDLPRTAVQPERCEWIGRFDEWSHSEQERDKFAHGPYLNSNGISGGYPKASASTRFSDL